MFEIRFPAAFPHAPPFFRILKPRFLPFSQVRGNPTFPTLPSCILCMWLTSSITTE